MTSYDSDSPFGEDFRAHVWSTKRLSHLCLSVFICGSIASFRLHRGEFQSP